MLGGGPLSPLPDPLCKITIPEDFKRCSRVFISFSGTSVTSTTTNTAAMLQVLAHPESWKVVFLAFLISLRQPLPFVLLVALFSTILVQPVSAQITQNGQLFTNALTIVDAPASQRLVSLIRLQKKTEYYPVNDSTLHAGSNINIALEVSP